MQNFNKHSFVLYKKNGIKLAVIKMPIKLNESAKCSCS